MQCCTNNALVCVESNEMRLLSRQYKRLPVMEGTFRLNALCKRLPVMEGTFRLNALCKRLPVIEGTFRLNALCKCLPVMEGTFRLILHTLPMYCTTRWWLVRKSDVSAMGLYQSYMVVWETGYILRPVFNLHTSMHFQPRLVSQGEEG